MRRSHQPMTRICDNLIRDQKSVWFFADQPEPLLDVDKPFRGLDSIYADVLPRDISLHVMPIGGQSEARKDFHVELEPADEELTSIIAQALADQDGSYHSRDLRRVVCDFVRRVAARLIRYEHAAFEIVLLRDRHSNELTACDLFEINVATLSRDADGIIQKVPPEVAVERKVPTIIHLDPDRLALFRLPPEFKNLRETKEALSYLGGSALFQMYEAAQADDSLGYDAKNHIRAEHLATAAATRSIGWNDNTTYYGLFSEYYVVHRRLTFEGFVIRLREAILATLNEAVAKIAIECGKRAELKVPGLPTLADVNRAKAELAAGSRTFNSVLDDFSLL